MDFDLSKKHCFYFNEISRIPRGSGNERAISDYVAGFAEKHGFDYVQDDILNVIVHKPASDGYEDHGPVMLQAHMDMVCEKNKDVEHDFERDPLDLYTEDGWLKARGTTLGADDGYGVAYMLAILDDPDLKHPDLYCYFTVMEEIGLVGASRLKKNDLHGKRYINLDGGGEVVTCVSSSGGARVEVVFPITKEKNTKPAYRLSVRGLSGGHSASKIHLEKGNANILAVRILKELQEKEMDVQLCDFDGGLKYNAIPREADAVFASSTVFEELEQAVQESTDKIAMELEFSDAGFFTVFEKTEWETVIAKENSDDFLNYMFLIPDGFQHRSMSVEGLTVASLNAGVIRTKENEISLMDLVRSPLASHTDELLMKMRLLGKVFHAQVNIGERYGGWNYSAESGLREKLREVLKAHGTELKERATHGGLECGVFKALDPELDIITYGPVAFGEHTPEEKLDLASFDRAYGILCELLENL